MEVIAANAPDRHRKGVGSDTVPSGVERNAQLFRWNPVIAPGHECAEAVGSPGVHPGADDQRVSGRDEPHLGGFRCGLSLCRFELDESRRGDGAAPGRFGEPAVDRDGCRITEGGHLADGILGLHRARDECGGADDGSEEKAVCHGATDEEGSGKFQCAPYTRTFVVLRL